MPFDRTTIQRAAAILAEAGVYVGTSSWKYDGWFDQLYTPARYEYRGKLAKTRFDLECLHEYAHGRDFVADLDKFLGKLPKGWPYGIEMRNSHWLREEYFGCLARHGVTHVYNSWDAMPPVNEQMALPGSRTNPALVAARFLL